jgi:outer membrane lipoprotein-sorting protein
VRTFLIAAFFFALLPAQTPEAPSLESVLSKMDAASAAFRNLTAHIRSVKYTAIVNDQTVDEGTIWVMRVKPRVSRMLIEFTSPDKYYVSVTEKKAEIYRPKIATIEEYDVTKYATLRDQFWLLSFGTSGRDLAANYQVRMEKPESVVGQPAVKLELIPKSAELLQHVPRIEMWVSTVDWQPVQQKFYDVTPGDYRLSTYTNIKLNDPKFQASRLEIHPPRGVKRIQPQK